MHECSIGELARLDAWLGTVIYCISHPDGRGGQRQRKFNSLFAEYLPLAMEKLLGNVPSIAHQDHAGELET